METDLPLQVCAVCITGINVCMFDCAEAGLQAVMYFRRALKLDRHYLSAWTLMGHEYVEMKNTSAAIGQSSPVLSDTHDLLPCCQILGDMLC